ncbi:MAG: hypothetical protein PWQ89_1758, partial [Verrucomicrobiota bacterium]|nr:hypothetical protein [Verrucomicrobiota bacterium]
VIAAVQLQKISFPAIEKGLKSIDWWRDPESNRGHEDFQSSALPTELSRREKKREFYGKVS